MQTAKTSVFDDVSYQNILNETKNKRTRSGRIRHWVFTSRLISHKLRGQELFWLVVVLYSAVVLQRWGLVN